MLVLPKGPFDDSIDTTLDGDLQASVKQALENGVELGQFYGSEGEGEDFPLVTPATGGWSVVDYLDTVAEAPSLLLDGELQFRFVWGRYYDQEEISDAIVAEILNSLASASS
jgi:hypothetical protein